MVSLLDSRLRHSQGVVEYTDHPDCIFRLQIIGSDDAFTLSDGTRLQIGERVLDLHLWNEHIPPFPDDGPTLSFARQIQRSIDVSLRELSRYLRTRNDLNDVCAIRGNLSLGGRGRSDQIARIAARVGFERAATRRTRSLRERLHLLGENMLISMLVLSQNSAALRADTLQRDRTLTYLSRRVLDERYGDDARKS